jgi:hypothetical protein
VGGCVGTKFRLIPAGIYNLGILPIIKFFYFTSGKIGHSIFPESRPKHGIGDTSGKPGAGFTSKHHSLDPYGGHGCYKIPMALISAGSH